MTDDQTLIDLLRTAQPPTAMTPPEPTKLAKLGRQRRIWRRSVAAGSLLVAAAIVTTLVLLPQANDRAELHVAASASPTPAGPLVFQGMQPLACGVGPLSVLSATPGAERANTPEAAALRQILSTGIAGEVFPPKTGWVVLARKADKVIFGHREGRIGIGDVVTVRRVGTRYEFYGSGRCGPIGYANGRQATNLDGYRVRDGKLTVLWTGGTCGDGSPPDTRVTETAHSISVLLVPPPDKPLPANTACAGSGTHEETAVPLASPVGNKSVEDAGYFPAIPLLRVS